MVADMYFNLNEVPAELRDCFEEVEVECGMPWARVVESKFRPKQNGVKGGQKGLNELDGRAEMPQGYTDTTTLGWRPSCQCIGADSFAPRPGLVLDPFCGSGRAGIQARRLGLDFVGCELSPSYADMAEKLLRDDCPLFAE
jgi:hypothetical protein